MTHICKNCNHHNNGNFCSECGQKFSVTSFTFKHILHEAFHAFTHADKGILVLMKKLILNPGNVAYEYIAEGKRKKYFNLFTFFVFITAIAAFAENKELAIKETVFHDNNEYGHLFNIYSKLLLLVTIPLVAFIIWLLHDKKNGFRYSEYTVFAMVLMSVKSMFDIVANTINYFLTAFFKIYGGVHENLFYAAFLIAFIAYANYGFHQKLKKSSWLRSILTGIGFCVVQVAITMFIVWAVIRDFNGLGVFSMYGIYFSK